MENLALDSAMSRNEIDGFLKSWDRLEKTLHQLPDKLNSVWAKAIQLGWYPAPYMPGTLSSTSLASQEKIDTRMLKAFEARYADAKQYVLDQAGERKHILSVAIQLHEQKNYIASIPLLLSQSDGIFESYLAISVFTRRKDKIKQMEDKLGDKFRDDSVAKAYFAHFSSRSQFSENSSYSENDNKIKAPNRNGILHGDRKHLDYGSYINSCKSICFLSSVLWLAEQYS